MTRIGIDTGGTFTDLVLWRDGVLQTHKVLSTPKAPEQAILQGIEDLGLTPRGLRLVHGSTVATNAVLEGKGARTLYVANRGLADILSIGRQARPLLYDLQPPPRRPPVEPALCLEVDCRLGADGRWIKPLSRGDIDALRSRVAGLAPESVAINLLFSYLDDSAERALAGSLGDGPFIARSSEVLPLTGEYERGIATWLTARVGPIVARYLRSLTDGLPGAGVSIMQSSGEAVSAERAARHTARLLLSGPAGGLAGAAFVARAAGTTRLLTFDMGGTSTDVAVIDGEARLTTVGQIAGFPVALPMVDMHTIGAGGGSIAGLDAGGMLRVGPESAGADPGPACYGRGARTATVTDANLVLGRLDPDGFLGGRMHLDANAARESIAALAQGMGVSIEEAALGIVRLADEHMARALRFISVQRGLDPRDFVLTSFGGAGGLHVCALADALGMRRALVPVHAGVLSALGMLVTPAGRTLTRTRLVLLRDASDHDITAALSELAEHAISELESEGLTRTQLRVDSSLDLRYRGQSHTLNLHWNRLSELMAAFHHRHQMRYGHRLDLPIELANLRVRVRGPLPELDLPALTPDSTARQGAVLQAFGCDRPIEVLSRGALLARGVLAGPAIIADPIATTWVAAGWRASLDAVGSVRLIRGDASW
jgi:N-methylhydantoinase A